MSPSVKSDKQWEAENDARTLTDAAAITADGRRMGQAKVAAKRMLKEEQVKARALQQVAHGKPKVVVPRAKTRKRK